MPMFDSFNDFETWARTRLDEMDAGLAAMEAEMRAPAEGLRAVGFSAMQAAQAWRDRFAARVRLMEEQQGSRLDESSEFLREAWTHFEVEMENWAVAAEQKSAGFDARARALLGAWYAAAAGYKAQAVSALDEQRAHLLAEAERLERQAVQYAERFEHLKREGSLSWLAMGQALKDSRAAFERAAATTRASFAEFLKKPH